jgi:hypothetical protein
VSAPCGLCSTEGIIGLLGVPDHFLDPMQASLVWFGRGYLGYEFPNDAKILDARIESPRHARRRSRCWPEHGARSGPRTDLDGAVVEVRLLRRRRLQSRGSVATPASPSTPA